MNAPSLKIKSLNKSREGFTLTEVLVALGLIVVTISLFMNSFVKARESAMLADDRMKAVNFTRMNLETLLTNTYVNLPVTNRPNWLTNSSISAGTTSLFFCGYSIITGQYVNSRQIRMTNTWTSARSRKTNAVTIATSVCSGFQY